jgi:polyphosphate kinase
MLNMLEIQLADNRKAVWVDESLRNVYKQMEHAKPVRAQYAFYEYLKDK